MHKITLYLIAFLLIFTISLENLTAYTQEITDEKMVTTQEARQGRWYDLRWPALHTSILNRDFTRVLLVLDIYPEEAKRKVHLNFPYQELHHTISGTTYYRPDAMGMSSLELAILCDAPIEIIEKLILLGASVNNQRIKQGPANCQQETPNDIRYLYYEIRTPLLAAVIKRNDKVIQLLLDYGANSEQVVYEKEIVERYWDDNYESYWYTFSSKGSWINLNTLLTITPDPSI